MNVILETNRLLFRPLILDDLDALAEIYADPEVMRYIGPPRNRDESMQALTKLIEFQTQYGFSLWATIEIATGQLIGRCGLHYFPIDGVQELEVAYMLARPAWGRGLGREAAIAIRDHAFTTLPVTRLVSCIDHDNIASKRVAEAMGMARGKDGHDQFGSFSVYFIDRTAWDQNRSTAGNEYR